MTKKSFSSRESVFATIANTTGEDVQDVQDAKDVKSTNKKGEQLERLNLKIPADIKRYLTIRAAEQSIQEGRTVSPTQYLCDLIRADMKKHERG